MKKGEKKLALGLINAFDSRYMILEGHCDIYRSYTGKLKEIDEENIGYYVVTTLISHEDLISGKTLPIVKQIGFIDECEGPEVLARYADCPNKDGWHTIKEEYLDGYTSDVMYSIDLDETENDGIYIYTNNEVAKKHTIVNSENPHNIDHTNSLYVISEMPNKAFVKLPYVCHYSLVEFTNYLPEFDSKYGTIPGFTIFSRDYRSLGTEHTNYYCMSRAAMMLMKKEKNNAKTST